MFRRQVIEPDPQPGTTEAGESTLRSRLGDAAWSAQDGLRRGSAEATRTTAELVREPFDRVSWGLRHGLVWRLEDRTEGSGPRTRALGFGLAVVLAAAVGVFGLIWAAPDGPQGPAASRATAVAVVTPAAPKPAPKPEPPAPTLHGAAPVFGPQTSSSAAKLGAAKELAAASHHHHASSQPSSTAASAATEVISSTPKQSSASASTAQESAAGKPAGPAAIGVAREFAGAFVRYETGDHEGEVRKTFGKTATPELTRALLRRPPRLPAHVKVPQAKVLNVVAGPSHGQVYAVSVSLLRVGVTSELRLSMERLKGKQWRVTNVLG